MRISIIVKVFILVGFCTNGRNLALAAFTTFEKSALERYLVIYDLGALYEYEAISAGIENSNYFVSLIQGDQHTHYVLTITEALSFEEVPFFNDLMSRLIKQGIPVPQAQRTLDGMSSAIFCGKPTWLFNRLPGEHPTTINIDQCFIIGENLAKIHIAGAETKYERANPYCSDWMQKTLRQVSHRIPQEELASIQKLADQYAQMENSSRLPKGIIHGDLFTDNALFEGKDLGGIIDFYHACNDFFIQDIAITLNDWCKTNVGLIDASLKASLLKGYQSVRRLSEEEEMSLPLFQQFAALRFALTRFLSGTESQPLKDPYELLTILRELPPTDYLPTS